ncbi:MAG: hypothetical protein GQ531_00295 [Sulfurovum sp.]|nr:hypothetical protein [Sulfurovum sp.]
MKKQMILLLTSTFLMGTSFAYADKKSTKANNANVETMTIMDKGVKRTVALNKVEKNGSLTPSANQKELKKGLLIRFKSSASVDIKDFEKKYDLKLKSKMKIGYYIFKNNSKESDVLLMQRIMENETEIESLKPNWKKRNTPR